MTTRKQFLNPDQKVGDVILTGMFGGAICNHWQLTAIEGSEGVWQKVTPTSVPNGDGTFSTKYVPAL